MNMISKENKNYSTCTLHNGQNRNALTNTHINSVSVCLIVCIYISTQYVVVFILYEQSTATTRLYNVVSEWGKKKSAHTKFRSKLKIIAINQMTYMPLYKVLCDVTTARCIFFFNVRNASIVCDFYLSVILVVHTKTHTHTRLACTKCIESHCDSCNVQDSHISRVM